MEKLLTVVVPVYKVEKYINKCLDSLIVPDEQMKKLEVICVNDGTPDNSAIMAKEYVKRYPDTFQVIDKENGGHGSAWNKGVELATGKYLRFLDSDDWLTNLSEFMTRLERFDVDLIFTDLQNVHESDRKFDRFYSCKMAMQPDKEYDAEEYDWRKTAKLHNGFNATNFQTCTYRTSILKRFHPVFFEKMYYDDEILFVLPLCVSKSFVYFDLILYNYLKGREGQTTDPKVLAKNVNFKVKIRKHQVLFYKENKPSNSNLNGKIQTILNSRNLHTFKLMAMFPLKESLSEMNKMYLWLCDNYPEFTEVKGLSLYKQSPFFYWLTNHYIKPFLWNLAYPFYNILPSGVKTKLRQSI
ncbi:MAG: glycosyltransferase [Prevotella sp.]|nr:glycosyltransferase [Prevotella sp.]